MNLGLISLTYISTLLLLSHASPVEHHPHDILFTAKSDLNWFFLLLLPSTHSLLHSLTPCSIHSLLALNQHSLFAPNNSLNLYPILHQLHSL